MFITRGRASHKQQVHSDDDIEIICSWSGSWKSCGLPLLFLAAIALEFPEDIVYDVVLLCGDVDGFGSSGLHRKRLVKGREVVEHNDERILNRKGWGFSLCTCHPTHSLPMSIAKCDVLDLAKESRSASW